MNQNKKSIMHIPSYGKQCWSTAAKLQESRHNALQSGQMKPMHIDYATHWQMSTSGSVHTAYQHSLSFSLKNKSVLFHKLRPVKRMLKCEAPAQHQLCWVQMEDPSGVE